MNADRSGLRGRVAEKTCRAVDFEHWPAFYRSFLWLAEMISSVAGHPHGPATVSVLSGDVHHSYAARVEWAGDSAKTAGATVHQLVCSLIHNYVPLLIKPAFTLAWTRPAATRTRWWARLRGVSPASAVVGEYLRSTVRKHHRHTASGRPHTEVLFVQPRGPDALDEVGRVSLSRPS